MKIGDSNFNMAVEIISLFTSQATVSFNVPVHDNYCNVYPILLKESCPALVSRLIKEGYSIGISEKGAYVEKF